jgi:hypothetical protein
VIYKEENGKAVQFYNKKITDGIEKKEILLLLISNETDEHLIWVKNQSAFFKNSAGNFMNCKKFPCLNCQNFSGNSQERLDEHRKACLKNEPSQVHLPKENTHLDFKHEGNGFMHPFTCFADFESTLLKCEESQGKGTTVYQKHQPNSYAIKYNCIYPQYSQPLLQFTHENSENVVKSFIENCERLAQLSYDVTFCHPEGSKNHYKIKKCQNCNCSFTD